MVPEKKIFKQFSNIQPSKADKPPGRGLFWPKGHNLNNLSRGPLDDITYQTSKPWSLWFQRRRSLSNFLVYSYVKLISPRGGALFGPRVII